MGSCLRVTPLPLLQDLFQIPSFFYIFVCTSIFREVYNFLLKNGMKAYPVLHGIDIVMSLKSYKLKPGQRAAVSNSDSVGSNLYN